MSAFGYRKPQDLPAAIPIFPLSGAILLPRGALPLNIFEPRYLNMIDDALGGDRLIGMVQPMDVRNAPRPTVASVGCAGRITSFAETEDGRYLITLTGVSRFHVLEELPVKTPYRAVQANWDRYGDDLTAPADSYRIDRDGLTAALRRYVDANGFQADWSVVDEAPPEPLINTLCAMCPFDPREKQMLIEAETLAERCLTLTTLLQLNASPEERGRLQ
jgi:Lon protease-like protein